ncbi:hypothetical protein Zmor_004478, partial [Zophobas morio]
MVRLALWLRRLRYCVSKREESRGGAWPAQGYWQTWHGFFPPCGGGNCSGFLWPLFLMTFV